LVQPYKDSYTYLYSEESRYGSTLHKQVYIYGGVDRGPTVVNCNFGLATAHSPSRQRFGQARLDGPLRLGMALPLGLRDVGYTRVSSSTGMMRTPAVWRSYSAKPG
jgi:hypothetical protein